MGKLREVLVLLLAIGHTECVSTRLGLHGCQPGSSASQRYDDVDDRGTC